MHSSILLCFLVSSAFSVQGPREENSSKYLQIKSVVPMKHDFENRSILELEMLRDVPATPSWFSQDKLNSRDSCFLDYPSQAGKGRQRHSVTKAEEGALDGSAALGCGGPEVSALFPSRPGAPRAFTALILSRPPHDLFVSILVFFPVGELLSYT